MKASLKSLARSFARDVGIACVFPLWSRNKAGGDCGDEGLGGEPLSNDDVGLRFEEEKTHDSSVERRRSRSMDITSGPGGAYGEE